MWIILKSLLNLLQYCFCSVFWHFGDEARGIWAPPPGMEPTPLLEDRVLNIGSPGRSLTHLIVVYPVLSTLDVPGPRKEKMKTYS